MTTHLMDAKGNPCCGGSNIWPNEATERRSDVDCEACLTPGLRKTPPSRPTAMDKLKDERAVLRAVLGEDAAGRPFAELLRLAANILRDHGGGPVEDCLRAKADDVEAALSNTTSREDSHV